MAEAYTKHQTRVVNLIIGTITFVVIITFLLMTTATTVSSNTATQNVLHTFVKSLVVILHWFQQKQQNC